MRENSLSRRKFLGLGGMIFVSPLLPETKDTAVTNERFVADEREFSWWSALTEVIQDMVFEDIRNLNEKSYYVSVVQSATELATKLDRALVAIRVYRIHNLPDPDNDAARAASDAEKKINEARTEIERFVAESKIYRSPLNRFMNVFSGNVEAQIIDKSRKMG